MIVLFVSVALIYILYVLISKYRNISKISGKNEELLCSKVDSEMSEIDEKIALERSHQRDKSKEVKKNK